MMMKYERLAENKLWKSKSLVIKKILKMQNLSRWYKVQSHKYWCFHSIFVQKHDWKEKNYEPYKGLQTETVKWKLNYSTGLFWRASSMLFNTFSNGSHGKFFEMFHFKRYNKISLLQLAVFLAFLVQNWSLLVFSGNKWKLMKIQILFLKLLIYAKI